MHFTVYIVLNACTRSDNNVASLMFAWEGTI